ncbi:hypothetical protein LguiB_005854 [Lonicera macranthoides]
MKEDYDATQFLPKESLKIAERKPRILKRCDKVSRKVVHPLRLLTSVLTDSILHAAQVYERLRLQAPSYLARPCDIPQGRVRARAF